MSCPAAITHVDSPRRAVVPPLHNARLQTKWLGRRSRRSIGAVGRAYRRDEKERILIVRRWCFASLMLLLPIITRGNSGQVTGAQNPPRVTRSITLRWKASTSAVMGYYVYRGTRARGPYAKLNFAPIEATRYDDNTVRAGLTYFYVVTSVDANHFESAYSKEISVTVLR